PVVLAQGVVVHTLGEMLDVSERKTRNMVVEHGHAPGELLQALQRQNVVIKSNKQGDREDGENQDARTAFLPAGLLKVFLRPGSRQPWTISLLIRCIPNRLIVLVVFGSAFSCHSSSGAARYTKHGVGNLR